MVGATIMEVPQVVETPINIDRLELFLQDYDPILKFQLVHGLRYGFDVGHRGILLNNLDVGNMTSCFENPEVVNEHLQSEIEAGRIAGPFDEPPFQNFQINRIGLVKKKEKNKFRMIYDLSHPKKTQ